MSMQVSHPHTYYELWIDTTKAGMLAAMEAIITTRSGIDSIIGSHYPLGRGVNVSMRVAIPDGQIAEFKRKIDGRGGLLTLPQVGVGLRGGE